MLCGTDSMRGLHGLGCCGGMIWGNNGGLSVCQYYLYQTPVIDEALVFEEIPTMHDHTCVV